jgi:hypothetical protein
MRFQPTRSASLRVRLKREPLARSLEYAERNIIMPLSFGIPLGLTIVVAGAILFFATNYKKIAKAVLGIGAAFILLTLILIVLAVNSQM